MPVVEVRRHDQPLERGLPEHGRQLQVGVIEHRLEAGDDEVGAHRCRIEAHQQEDKQEQDDGRDQFEQMHTGASDPVHVLDAVVNGMDAPKKRNFVKSAMRPVLNGVDHQQGQKELGKERQAADPCPQGWPDHPTEQAVQRNAGRD